MKNFLINQNVKLSSALRLINKGGYRSLIVVDKENKLLGTLTDSDIRRAIIKGIKNHNSINNFYNQEPIFFKEKKYTIKKIKSKFLSQRLDLIPIVDKTNKLVKILFWDKILKNKKHLYKKMNTSVVIMSGGKGMRLKPFTNILPKPLIPIKNKAVIQHIIDSFTIFGINDFFITINYKGKILKAYYEELKPLYKVKFIEESKSLGTAGSLGIINDKTSNPIIVTNCDIIAKINYFDFLNHHKKSKNDITLAVSASKYVIPYGVCELEDSGNLNKIVEKPKMNVLVNAGIYIINKDILKLIPKDKFYNFTDLISDSKKNEKKIGVFPIPENKWFDIGQWSEYHKTVKKLSSFND